MAHQCDAASLRCAAEESNLDVVLPELVGELQCCSPSVRAASVPMVLDRSEVGTEASISLDDSTETDLEKWNQ